MAENLTPQEGVNPEQATQVVVAPTASVDGKNPFVDYLEAPPQVNPTPDTSAEPTPVSQTTDYADVLKTKFGAESFDELEQKFQELQKSKESAPNLEFTNEESKQIFESLREGKEDEILNYLQEKKKLENLFTSEVDEKTAEELVKLNLSKRFPELTQSEIDRKFNKQFGAPKSPVQSEFETDEEFEVKMQEYQEQFNEWKADLIIEAKTLKPELEKYKKDLKLPEISKAQNVEQDNSQVDEFIANQRKAYLDALESNHKNFNGFNVSYKGEDAEIPVQYIVSDEEKVSLKASLESFDQEGFFASRWFSQDGKPNVTQTMEDIYLLQNKDKIFQKFANEVGAKVLAQYIQKTSNIQINQPQQTNPNVDGKTEQAKLAEFFFSQ